MPVVYPNVPSHLYEEHPPPKKNKTKTKNLQITTIYILEISAGVY